MEEAMEESVKVVKKKYDLQMTKVWWPTERRDYKNNG